MMHLIHIDPRLDNHIEDLRRAGKKGRIAAEHAEQVISAMQHGGPAAARHLPQTHKGELRLDGCIKYDLGGGYRMLTVKQGKERFILFAGSHDDCDRWIENNRELAFDLIRERCRHHRVMVNPESESDPTIPQNIDTPEGLNPTDLCPELDQKVLRLVFAGLCGTD